MKISSMLDVQATLIMVSDVTNVELGRCIPLLLPWCRRATAALCEIPSYSMRLGFEADFLRVRDQRKLLQDWRHGPATFQGHVPSLSMGAHTAWA